MKRTSAALLLVLMVLIAWVGFVANRSSACDGVLVVRAWPPGWVCVQESP